MRVLLDTVTFIWAMHSPECISKKAVDALHDSRTLREMSAVSLSEIAIKQSIGKLDFDRDAVITGITDLKLRILPYTLDHALELFSLPLHHSDPFDRQIIVQALVEKIPVITADEKFQLYKGLRIIW